MRKEIHRVSNSGPSSIRGAFLFQNTNNTNRKILCMIVALAMAYNSGDLDQSPLRQLSTVHCHGYLRPRYQPVPALPKLKMKFVKYWTPFIISESRSRALVLRYRFVGTREIRSEIVVGETKSEFLNHERITSFRQICAKAFSGNLSGYLRPGDSSPDTSCLGASRRGGSLVVAPSRLVTHPNPPHKTAASRA